MLTAIVTNDFKPRWCIFTDCRFFGTAFWTSLRLRLIPMVILHLLFFRKKKNLFALNTRKFKVWHRFYLLWEKFNINSKLILIFVQFCNVRPHRFAQSLQIIPTFQNRNDSAVASLIRPLFYSPSHLNIIRVLQHQLSKRIS